MDIMNKKSVAARLGVSERTIENWVKARKLPPAVILGKQAYWATDVIDAFQTSLFQAQLAFNASPAQRLVPGARLERKRRTAA